MEPLLIFLKAMAVSVVVTFHPSITLACLNHLSDWVNVIWLPSDPDSPNLENSWNWKRRSGHLQLVCFPPLPPPPPTPLLSCPRHLLSGDACNLTDLPPDFFLASARPERHSTRPPSSPQTGICPPSIKAFLLHLALL